MNDLFYYLLQVTGASGILYLYYHLALRNKKFHQYNRFYLLSAILISMLVPFLNIPVYFTRQENQWSLVVQALRAISPGAAQDTVGPPGTGNTSLSGFHPLHLVYAGYGLIAGFFLLRIILSLARIRKMAYRNPVEQLDELKFISTADPQTPFSFFNWLFWNRNIELHSEKGQQVFRHELFHIRQKHSFDLLLMELSTAIFWINPFFYLIKREVQTVHEFLADHFAAEDNKKWNYAELLLTQALHTRQALVNPFFHNQIKRRIAMITNSKKTNYRYFRKLSGLPVAAIVLALFAFKYNTPALPVPAATLPEKVLQDSLPPLLVIDGKKMPGLTMAEAEHTISPDQIESVTVWKDATAVQKYGPEGRYGVVEIKTKAPKERRGTKETTPWTDSLPPLIVIDGQVMQHSAIKSMQPDQIESINVLKDTSATNKYGPKGKNGVIEIKTKKDTIPIAK